MKAKAFFFLPIFLGLFLFALSVSSCKNDKESVGIESSVVESPSVQKSLVSASLAFENGENDIRQLTSDHLFAFYVQIVGLSSDIEWDEPEIIEIFNDTLSSTSYFVRTTSTDGNTSVTTTVDKVGSDYLLVNRLGDPVYTCTCTSTECVFGCEATKANPCTCSHCSKTCTKTSSVTEAAGLLGFLRGITKTTM